MAQPARGPDPASAIAAQIRHAGDTAALGQAAQRVDALVAQWQGNGAAIEALCSQVCELNRALFARAWGLLAAPELVAHSCLVVMGSEGRGEQLLKADQDNALLLRDGLPMDGVAAAAERFSAALADFGYPRCPGHVMLSNPLWCQPLAAFKQTLRGWMFDGDADAAMNLAIFLDAAAVAGDAGLLQRARGFVDVHLVDNDAFFARFASAADQFGEPGGWWSRLTHLRSHDEAAIDLKKLGTFPVVHGVRSLAWQHHVGELGTAARLRVLAERGHVEEALADELTHALHALMALKLAHQLRQREAGEPLDNVVPVAALAPHEHEVLKDALASVRRFRRHLHQHYRLDSL